MPSDYKVEAIVNEDNAEYHRFLKKGELRCQRCSGCGYVRPPASWICPECLSEEYSWEKLTGRGEVHTFIWYFEDILDPRYVQGWAWREVPYNVAIVKLAEGPQLITNVVDVTFEELSAGQAVEARFVDISPEFAILRFALAKS